MKVRCSSCFQEYEDTFGLCPFCGYTPMDPPEEAFCLPPGTVIADRYIVGGMLALGGFGIVYRAWDKKLDAMLAIKEYYPSGIVNRLPGETNLILAAARREREFVHGKLRFLEEARNMAKFSTHKNIVNVFDFFEANNTAYIIMEYLDGRTMSQVLQQQNVPLPYDYCINIAESVCAALQAIHKENILHRDVSPDNIMICNNGNIKLFDFGAARFSAGVENRVTVVVKPGFAPPEQYDKVNRQDPRTDIYALGATLYYAMTGAKPEESTNRKIKDTLLEPSTIDSSIPANISTAIMRAMSIEPQYRFSTAEEFKAALTNGKKVASVKKERAKRKRRRIFGITAALLAAIGIIAVIFYALGRQKDETGLPDADLLMWYIQTGSEEIDQSKARALKSIVDTFTNEYRNVKVELVPMGREEYANALGAAASSGQMPALFEATNLDENGMIPLENELVQLQYTSYYVPQMGTESQYPTGIVVPIIYMNTDAGSVDFMEDIQQITDFCNEFGGYFEVKRDTVDMYSAIYGNEIANYVADTAIDDFLSRDAWIYFGDSSDYFTIQRSLSGGYSLLMPGSENAVYRYGACWSVSASDENTQRAAVALVTYLGSDLAQDYLHIQAESPDLPITHSAMTEFLSIYSELECVKEYLKRPFAEPAVDVDQLMQTADPSALDELKNGSAPAFEDVSEGEWYTDAVNSICSRGLMDPADENHFGTNQIVDRASVIVSLYRLASSPEPEGAALFSGMGMNTELQKAAAWAYESGIISNSEDGLLHEAGTVNLETLAVMFYRYASHFKLDLSADIDLLAYSDGESISGWAQDAISWGITHKIVTTQAGGAIAAKGTVSRARLAVFLDRMIQGFAL